MERKSKDENSFYLLLIGSHSQFELILTSERTTRLQKNVELELELIARHDYRDYYDQKPRKRRSW